MPRLRLASLALGLIAIALAALAVWWPWRSSHAVAVAVSAADSSATSQGYAQDLLAQLGQLQSAQPDALQLVGPEARKRATLLFELAGTAEGQRARANLVLLDGKSRGLLWSKSFERPLKEAGDLHQQLGYTAAQVLECAAEARPGGRMAIAANVLKLYLNGCAAYVDKTPENIQPLARMFLQLTREAPHFADGWAKLLLVESEYTRMTYLPETASVLSTVPAHIAAARKLEPDMPEAFLAEASLLPDKAFERRLDLLQRALDRDPNNAAILSFRSDQLRFVGRTNEALEDAQRAVQANPLSPTIRYSLVSALTYAGKIDAALAEVRRLGQIWPGASNVSFARFLVDLRYGDPHEALRLIQSGDVSASNTPYVESFLRARIDPSPANVDRAVEEARSWYERTPTTIYHLVQVLGTFGRDEEVFAILLNWSYPDEVIYAVDGLFRPALTKVHRDPRMIAVAKRLGLLDYWVKSGHWPDFCFQPDLPYDCKKEAAKLTA
jgi:tetratricopeptide (TPR) repeat protein